jgi:8-oxo-dGTP pyrophosphatase MutT (NUDIX family)
MLAAKSGVEVTPNIAQRQVLLCGPAPTCKCEEQKVCPNLRTLQSRVNPVTIHARMSRAAPTEPPAFDFTFDPSDSLFTASQQSYLAAHADTRFNHIATGAFVFDTTNPSTPRLLLLQRSASDSMPNKWEIPGGGCDDEDESILHAVARELWEEAGLKAARISGPIGDPHFFSSRSGKKICKFNFVVQAETDAAGGLAVKLSPEEHQQFIWVSEDEVKAKKTKDVDIDFTTAELEHAVKLAFDQLVKR